MYRAMLAVVFSLIFVVVAVPTAYAGGEVPPPPCTKDCKQICHNIGGPRDLGANCDMTGTCTYTLGDGGGNLTLGPNQFLGIVISFNQDSAAAFAAHIAHGDGGIVATFDPALHLASTDGPHRDSNVECIGTRVFPQPPEPGN